MCCGIKFVNTEEWFFLSLGRNKVQSDFFPDLCQYWPVIWGGKNSDLRPVPLIDLCVPTVTSAVVIQTWNVYWLQIQADLLTTWQVRPLRCCRKGVPFFQHLLMWHKIYWKWNFNGDKVYCACRQNLVVDHCYDETLSCLLNPFVFVYFFTLWWYLLCAVENSKCVAE